MESEPYNIMKTFVCGALKNGKVLAQHVQLHNVCTVTLSGYVVEIKGPQQN